MLDSQNQFESNFANRDDEIKVEFRYTEFTAR